ncbi:MAG TPA: phosphoribosylglycinamide formyltransferase [Candidatus Cloacimonetes bacterium]|nr:phosphoribosylglycinamide formyltransferase [Candidatus Cloacimonadota bacterium]
MKKILIMITGRGSNMRAIAENAQNGILKDYCEITEVFSNKKDAPGLEIAANFGLETCVIESKGKKRKTYNSLLLEHLKKKNPDFIILAGYMKIIAPEIVQEFPNRIINIHPADTALHQGLHGYEWAFENKLKTTKVTVHFVDEGLDTGKVIGKKEVDISECKTIEEVEQKGLKIEHRFYSECLKEIMKP